MPEITPSASRKSTTGSSPPRGVVPAKPIETKAATGTAPVAGTAASSSTAETPAQEFVATALRTRSDPAALRLAGSHITDAHLAAFAANPQEVKALTLKVFDDVTPDGLAQLASVPLTSLTIKSRYLTVKDAQALAKCTTLESLDLSNCKVSPEAMAALAKLPALKSVNLNSRPVGVAMAEALRLCSQLETLDLKGSKVDDATLKVLLTGLTADLPSLLSSLKTIDLSDNNALTAKSIELLANTKHLKNISFNDNMPHGANFGLLATLPALKTLSLNNINKLVHGDKSLRATVLAPQHLAALAESSSLTTLSLQKNSLSDAAIAPLTVNDKLETLDLGFNQLTDQSAYSISEMPALKAIDLRENPVGAGGASALMENKGGSLEEIGLLHTKIKADEVANWPSNQKLQKLEISHAIVSVEMMAAIGNSVNLTTLTLSSITLPKKVLPAESDESKKGLLGGIYAARKFLKPEKYMTSTELLNALKPLKSLQNFCCSNNRFGEEVLISPLKSFPLLESLDVSHNKIDSNNSSLSSIPENKYLHNLNISHCSSPRSYNLFFLDKFENLHYLDFSGNEISGFDISPIAKKEHLRHLYLTFPIKIDSDISVPFHVSEALPKLKNLESLETSFIKIFPGANECQNLTHLKIGNFPSSANKSWVNFISRNTLDSLNITGGTVYKSNMELVAEKAKLDTFATKATTSKSIKDLLSGNKNINEIVFNK